MSTRYRMIWGTAAVVAVLAVGGIAAADQGGQSGDHRQNPTTTSGPLADPTSTTTTTVVGADGNPNGTDNQGDAEDQGQGPSSESQHARCDIALNNGAPIAQWNKAQAPAFADCNSPLLGTPRPQPGNGGGQGQGGAPANSNAGGNGNGGNGNGGGPNAHAATAPGHNK